MLGFSLKYIDSERMILDDWSPEFAVFESPQWDHYEDEEEAEVEAFNNTL